MELRTQLNFDDAKIVSLTRYPGEKGIKAVLIISASFMPAHAEIMGHSYVYKDSIPVADLDDLSIGGELRDIELRLPNAFNRTETDLYRPELIYKFKLKRVADAKYEVTFRVHEYGNSDGLNDFMDAVNKDVFALSMSPMQAELGFEGGTRVDLAEDKDRSYENKTVAKRGRKKVTPISTPEPEDEATTEVPEFLQDEEEALIQ